MALCWHTLPKDPPGTKPYVTWGPEEECPVCHPELYEPYGKPVVSDYSSGEPCTPDGKWIPHIIHCGQWLQRKKVSVDPIKQLVSPVAEVRKQVTQWVDEYGDTWAIIDGIETKVAYANPVALMKRQDGVRVEIRKALDEIGIRDRTIKETINVGTKENPEFVEVEMLPPGDAGANVLQFNMDPTPANIEKATALTEAAERALAAAQYRPLPPLTRWQRIKRTAKRLFRQKGRRR